MGVNSYKIIQFKNKDNKLDIAIVSDKWLNVNGEQVYTYCPPSNNQSIELAKAHFTPLSSWGKCDVLNTLFVEMNWNRTWKKYQKLRKEYA